jgi:hypothetical protein
MIHDDPHPLACSVAARTSGHNATHTDTINMHTLRTAVLFRYSLDIEGQDKKHHLKHTQ